MLLTWVRLLSDYTILEVSKTWIGGIENDT